MLSVDYTFLESNLLENSNTILKQMQPLLSLKKWLIFKKALT